MPHVLIIEDDEKLAALEQEYLERAGFRVTHEGRGDAAVERLSKESPDLVVLDLMLPGLDGFEVCRRVREHYRGPILMLTARSEDEDELLGLEIGADDYLRKPVSPRLLLARIRAHLRRAEDRADQRPNVVCVQDLSLDVGSRVATLQGETLDLTTAEFDLLHYLAARAGTAVGRRELFAEVKGVPYGGLDRSVDLTIARLRKKLGDDARQPRWIKSVRGVGYQLAIES